AIEEILAAGYPALPLLNAIVGMSAIDASFPGLLDALEAAASGDTSLLDAIVASVEAASTANTLHSFSSGTHLATMCADTAMPWGGADVATKQRAAALQAAVAQLRPEDTWPFPTSLAREIGVVQSCLHWPAAAFNAPVTTPLSGM